MWHRIYLCSKPYNYKLWLTRRKYFCISIVTCRNSNNCFCSIWPSTTESIKNDCWGFEWSSERKKTNSRKRWYSENKNRRFR
jgi:hypothetical protein